MMGGVVWQAVQGELGTVGSKCFGRVALLRPSGTP